MNKNLNIIIQARLNSSRFPNKVIKKIGNHSLIEILFKRLIKSKNINKIILATSKNPINNPLEDICKKNDIICYRGSETNVLDRFIKINELYKAKYISRITADCPLIDFRILDTMFVKILNTNIDFISNNDPPTFPDGLDIEIFKSNLLKKVTKIRTTIYEKEHVTPALKKIALNKFTYKSKTDYSDLRVTVDEIKDYHNLKKLLNFYKNNIYINKRQIIDFLLSVKIKHPKTMQRNHGSSISYGIKYWNRANKFILNGNNFFSKRPDLYEPTFWPTYFSKSKGSNIWDLEGNKFLDATYMGIGTNTLGYSNKDIDNYVITEIKKGNMTTLNSNLDIELAEKLLNLDNKCSKVKFVRGCAEASS